MSTTKENIHHGAIPMVGFVDAIVLWSEDEEQSSAFDLLEALLPRLKNRFNLFWEDRSSLIAFMNTFNGENYRV
jgi:hypothetical protein